MLGKHDPGCPGTQRAPEHSPEVCVRVGDAVEHDEERSAMFAVSEVVECARLDRLGPGDHALVHLTARSAGELLGSEADEPGHAPRRQALRSRPVRPAESRPRWQEHLDRAAAPNSQELANRVTTLDLGASETPLLGT